MAFREILTLRWENGKAYLIDQTKLPEIYEEVEISTYKQMAEAITTMIVRGAPAIGVAAALGAALGAREIQTTSTESFLSEFKTVTHVLAKTRPTAVNLFWALQRMESFAATFSGTSVEALKDGLEKEALRIMEEDISINKAMGDHGASVVPRKARILTICNAGALATAAYGTALGVIRSAHRQGNPVEVYACETRPRGQGRLTAWELVREEIPVTYITDNMVAHIMGRGLVDLVIAGADRIAANGDTANKIGTYGLGILARAHNIPFYIAAPTSTIDPETPSGEGIVIEHRSDEEVTHIMGRRFAPEGVKIVNPAFDVTPSTYISGIITEKGLIKAPFRENISAILQQGKELHV